MWTQDFVYSASSCLIKKNVWLSDRRLPDGAYSEEFPSDGQISDYPLEDYEESGFESYQLEDDFSDNCTGQTPYHDNDNFNYPKGSFQGGFGLGGNTRRGLLDGIPNKSYPMDFTRGQIGGNLNRQMETPLERQSLMGANLQNGSQSNSLLSYLVYVNVPLLGRLQWYFW